MKATFNRDFYKPRNGKLVREEPGVIEAYYSDSLNAKYPYHLVVFGGKRSKPDLNYIYKTEKEREDALEKHHLNLVRRLADNIARKEARKAEKHSLKVGDILSESWGYDQTNYDFYQVTRVVSDKSVEIRHINSKRVEGGHFTEELLVPNKDDFGGWGEGDRSGKPFVKRASSDNYVKISSFSCASPWSGKPCAATNPLFGH